MQVIGELSFIIARSWYSPGHHPARTYEVKTLQTRQNLKGGLGGNALQLLWTRIAITKLLKGLFRSFAFTPQFHWYILPSYRGRYHRCVSFATGMGARFVPNTKRNTTKSIHPGQDSNNAHTMVKSGYYSYDRKQTTVAFTNYVPSKLPWYILHLVEALVIWQVTSGKTMPSRVISKN